jgi:hypothetical protein
MTKKDYILLAKVMRNCRPQEHEDRVVWKSWRNIVDNLDADLFEDNSRFDYARFCKACGMED